MLLAIFSLAASGLGLLFATNKELGLIPPLETLTLFSQATIAFGVLTCLILGADSISGERDRGSLEALLLTPASRRSLVIGKFLAALTPWPAILAIAAPFLYVLAPGGLHFADIFWWTSFLGTFLVIGFTGLSVLISMRAASNKASLAMSLTIFLVAMIPTQLPGTAQTGGLGLIMKKLNPAESTLHLIEKLTVNNNSPAYVWDFFLSPIGLPVIVLLILLLRRNPTIPLAGGDS